MRPSRIACLVIAALDALVLARPLSPARGEDLMARVPISAGGAKSEKPNGGSVLFRLRGEATARDSAPVAAPPPEAPSEAPPEEPIDSDCFAYLGTMTSSDGSDDYFFKDMATNRVYSTGRRDGEIKVLETSGKEFLIEIDGTRYKVER